jgi:hypothetical protein
MFEKWQPKLRPPFSVLGPQQTILTAGKQRVEWSLHHTGK